MAYKKNGSLISLKGRFQSFSCLYIHMVGGLIQNQEIGAALQKLCQHQSGLFPAGQGAYFSGSLLSRKEIGAQDRPHLLMVQGREKL